MIQNFKIKDKHWSGVFFIMDKVIFEHHTFQDNGTRDSNLRLFLSELLTFNLEYFTQRVKKKEGEMDFRQKEALGILLSANKWFIDNRYNLKLILPAFEKLKIQIDDLLLGVEEKWRRDSLYEDYEVIKKWFEYNSNKFG